MRGVHLGPGSHQVEFKFDPPVGMLYVSLAAEGVGLVLLCMLVVGGHRSRAPSARPARKPQFELPEPGYWPGNAPQYRESQHLRP
jgi:hypothetical protein